jgi:hypothetical protein
MFIVKFHSTWYAIIAGTVPTLMGRGDYFHYTLVRLADEFWDKNIWNRKFQFHLVRFAEAQKPPPLEGM